MEFNKNVTFTYKSGSLFWTRILNHDVISSVQNYHFLRKLNSINYECSAGDITNLEQPVQTANNQTERILRGKGSSQLVTAPHTRDMEDKGSLEYSWSRGDGPANITSELSHNITKLANITSKIPYNITKLANITSKISQNITKLMKRCL